MDQASIDIKTATSSPTVDVFIYIRSKHLSVVFLTRAVTTPAFNRLIVLADPLLEHKPLPLVHPL